MGKLHEFFQSDTSQIKVEVDLTSQFLMQDKEDWLSALGAPIRVYDSFDILKFLYQEINPIAHIIGEGGEIPAFQRNDWSTERVFFAKHGAAIDYFERHMRQMMEWDRLVTGVPTDVKTKIFGDVSTVVTRVANLSKRLMTEVLYTGDCAFTDATTGQAVTLSYSGSDTTLYPAALAGGDTWDTPVTATPIANLRAHTEAYRSVGFPTRVVMNSNTYAAMLATNEVRESVLAMKFGEIAGAGNYPITDADLEMVLSASQRGVRIPPITMIDATYQEVAADGTITESSYIPDGYYFLMWDNNAECALAPTVEGDGAGGIYSNSEEVTKTPPHDRLYAVANGIPFIRDTRKMGGRQVY